MSEGSAREPDLRSDRFVSGLRFRHRRGDGVRLPRNAPACIRDIAVFSPALFARDAATTLAYGLLRPRRARAAIVDRPALRARSGRVLITIPPSTMSPVRPLTPDYWDEASPSTCLHTLRGADGRAPDAAPAVIYHQHGSVCGARPAQLAAYPRRRLRRRLTRTLARDSGAGHPREFIGRRDRDAAPRALGLQRNERAEDRHAKSAFREYVARTALFLSSARRARCRTLVTATAVSPDAVVHEVRVTVRHQLSP